MHLHDSRPPRRPRRRFRSAARARYGFGALLFLALSFTALSQQPGSASLLGNVRDTQGNPVADAVANLRSINSSATFTARTDSHGGYNFAGLHEGVYTLRVERSGYAEAEFSSVFLAPKENKRLDLVLGALKGDQSAVGSPQFFDQPHFTVSGVTDATNLGGHGSDTVVRTRETLAKETVSLGKPSPGDTSSDTAASEKALRDNAENLRARLVEHDEPKLHHQLGDVEERLGDALEAVHQYQQAAEMDPSETNLFDWGAELLLHHAPEPAIAVFTQGNHSFPRSARMLVGLGAAWFTSGNNDEAVRRVCAASDLNPGEAFPDLFLGKMLPALSPPSANVLERLRRFVTLQPQNADANYYYAVALGKLGERPQDRDKNNASQIESFLNKALRLNPNYAAAYLRLGILHAEQGKHETAVSDYQRAIQLDPQLEQAHYRLAQEYRRLGETDQAAEELQIYEQLAKESAKKAERERHEIRQFVYTLRDQSSVEAH